MAESKIKKMPINSIGYHETVTYNNNTIVGGFNISQETNGIINSDNLVGVSIVGKSIVLQSAFSSDLSTYNLLTKEPTSGTFDYYAIFFYK